MGIIEGIIAGAVLVLAGAATAIVLTMYAAEAVRKVWRRK